MESKIYGKMITISAAKNRAGSAVKGGSVAGKNYCSNQGMKKARRSEEREGHRCTLATIWGSF